jgi:hypothetical protein
VLPSFLVDFSVLQAIRHCYISDINKSDVFFLGGIVLRSSISLSYNQFKIFISLARKFHHKVLYFVLRNISALYFPGVFSFCLEKNI